MVLTLAEPVSYASKHCVRLLLRVISVVTPPQGRHMVERAVLFFFFFLERAVLCSIVPYFTDEKIEARRVNDELITNSRV